MQFLLDNIGNKFSWARYGDGEWNAILGKQGQNCDKHIYFPDMGERLKAILESRPTYSLGLQAHAVRQLEGVPEFDRLVSLNTWNDSDVLHKASIKGQLEIFFEALKPYKVMLVANAHLQRLKLWNKYIVIPETNCWLAYESTKEQIADQLEEGIVVLYCASMMSNVLIDDFADRNITQIDCGSVFDPYAGRLTRSYHKDLEPYGHYQPTD